PVAGVDSGDDAFRAGAQFNGVDSFNATRDLTLGGVGGLLHGGDTHGNGRGECGWQGAGEEREQEWEFHGSTSALFSLTPALSHREREVRVPSPCWRGLG